MNGKIQKGKGKEIRCGWRLNQQDGNAKINDQISPV